MLLADKPEEAVSSPLTSALALSSGKDGDKTDQKVICKRSQVQAVLKGIKQVKSLDYSCHLHTKNLSKSGESHEGGTCY